MSRRMPDASQPARRWLHAPVRWRIFLAITLGVLAFDQCTKFLAVKHLTPGIAVAVAPGGRAAVGTRSDQRAVLGASSVLEQVGAFYGAVTRPCRDRPDLCPHVRVIDGFWGWRYLENEGAAWSIFASQPEWVRKPVLIGGSLAALFAIVWLVRRLQDGARYHVAAFGLVAGGALGNIVDRIRLGYVIDFIHWYYGRHVWPTFNVADSAVSLGLAAVALLSVADFLSKRTEARTSPALRTQTR